MDDLSPAELAFRQLLSRPAEYARWAAGVRLAWERQNVVWLHGYHNGQPVWRRERPPQAPEGERSRFGRTPPTP